MVQRTLQQLNQLVISERKNLNALTVQARQINLEFESLNRQKQDVSNILRKKARFNRAIGIAKDRLRSAKKFQDIAQGRLTTEQIKQKKLAKRQIKTITVSVGGARNTIETRQVTRAGKTKTTFINRETGGRVVVDRKSTFAELSKATRKTLTRGPKVTAIKKDKVTKVKTKLRSIAQLIPGITLKQRVLSSEAFTKKELTIIREAKDPEKAVKVIEELRKREEKAIRQKIQSFLRISIGKITTQKQVDNLNKAIDRETKKRQDKGFQRDEAVNQVIGEVKQIKSSLRKGKVSLKGIKIFGVNVVNGFIGVFTAPIIGSYNYGQELVNRGLWSKRKDNPLLKDVSKVIVKGTINTVKVTRFVITKPTEAQIIVGAAAAIGGVSLLKGLRKNPGRTLGEAVAILFPGTVIKAVGVSAKISKAAAIKVVKATNKAAVGFNKAIKTNLKKKNPLSEKNLLTTALVESTSLPPALKQLYINTLKNKNVKELRGIVKSSATQLKLQKSITVSVKKIPRTAAQIKAGRKKVVVKEKARQRTEKLKQFKKFLIDSKNAAALRFNKLIKDSFGRGKKIFEKNFLITSLVEATKFPPALKQLYRNVLQKKSLKELRVLTGNTRQALALQKRIIVPPSKLVSVKIISPKTKAVQKAEFNKFVNQFPKDINKGRVININKATRNALFKNKKGQLRIKQIMINKGDELLKESRRVDRVIRISKQDIIKARVKLKIGKEFARSQELLQKAIAWEKANNLLKGLNVNVTAAQRAAVRIVILKAKASKLLLGKNLSLLPIFDRAKTPALESLLATDLVRQQIPIVKNIQDLKSPQDLKVIQQKITKFAFAQEVLSKLKQPEKLKLALKKITKAPTTPRKLSIPNFRLLKRSGSRAGFIIRIKQGDKIISLTKDLLPMKRAINFMRRRLDNNLRASGETVKVGTTSIVDVSKTILDNKFRTKRGKDPKVRIEVEKRKFRLDKPGERSRKRKSKPLKRFKSKKRIGKKKK